MNAGTFFGALVAMFVGALLLVWTFASAAALVFALAQGDDGAAALYAGFTVAGVLACLLGAWVARRVVRRVARSRARRQ